MAGFWSIPGAQPDGRLPVMQRHGAWPRRVECSTLPRFEVGHAAPPTLGDELCMPVGTIHGACERVLGGVSGEPGRTDKQAGRAYTFEARPRTSRNSVALDVLATPPRAAS